MRRLSLTVDEELNAVLEAFCTEERCSKADVAKCCQPDHAAALSGTTAGRGATPGLPM